MKGEDAISNFAPRHLSASVLQTTRVLEKLKRRILTVEQQQISGGVAQMYKYIGENMKYPSAAQTTFRKVFVVC
jgi:hypothetical protein